MKCTDAKSITRKRTSEERLRRHFYGDDGATFQGRYMTVGERIMGTITTFTNKDNLVAEIYEK